MKKNHGDSAPYKSEIRILARIRKEHKKTPESNFIDNAIQALNDDVPWKQFHT